MPVIETDDDGWCFYNTILAAFRPYRADWAARNEAPAEKERRSRVAQKLAFLLAKKALRDPAYVGKLTYSITHQDPFNAGDGILGLQGDTIIDHTAETGEFGFPSQLSADRGPRIRVGGTERQPVTEGSDLLTKLYTLRTANIIDGPIVWPDYVFMLPILQSVFEGYGFQLRQPGRPDPYTLPNIVPDAGDPTITIESAGNHFQLRTDDPPANAPINADPIEILERQIFTPGLGAAAAPAAPNPDLPSILLDAIEHNIYTIDELTRIFGGNIGGVAGVYVATAGMLRLMRDAAGMLGPLAPSQVQLDAAILAEILTQIPDNLVPPRAVEELRSIATGAPVDPAVAAHIAWLRANMPAVPTGPIRRPLNPTEINRVEEYLQRAERRGRGIGRISLAVQAEIDAARDTRADAARNARAAADVRNARAQRTAAITARDAALAQAETAKAAAVAAKDAAIAAAGAIPPTTLRTVTAAIQVAIRTAESAKTVSLAAIRAANHTALGGDPDDITARTTAQTENTRADTLVTDARRMLTEFNQAAADRARIARDAAAAAAAEAARAAAVEEARRAVEAAAAEKAAAVDAAREAITAANTAEAALTAAKVETATAQTSTNTVRDEAAAAPTDIALMSRLQASEDALLRVLETESQRAEAYRVAAASSMRNAAIALALDPRNADLLEAHRLASERSTDATRKAKESRDGLAREKARKAAAERSRRDVEAATAAAEAARVEAEAVVATRDATTQRAETAATALAAAKQARVAAEATAADANRLATRLEGIAAAAARDPARAADAARATAEAQRERATETAARAEVQRLLQAEKAQGAIARAAAAEAATAAKRQEEARLKAAATKIVAERKLAAHRAAEESKRRTDEANRASDEAKRLEKEAKEARKQANANPGDAILGMAATTAATAATEARDSALRLGDDATIAATEAKQAATAASKAHKDTQPDETPSWATGIISEPISDKCMEAEFITPECIARAAQHSAAVADRHASLRAAIDEPTHAKYLEDPITAIATETGPLTGDKLSRWVQLSDKYKDRRIKIRNPNTGRTEEMIVSNPYRAKHYRDAILARGGTNASFGNPTGDPPTALTDDTYGDHPEDVAMWQQNALLLNKVAPSEIVTNNKMAIGLLESLWFCGSSADVASDPRCFPARALGELREYQATKTQEQRAALAKKAKETSRWDLLKRSIGMFSDPLKLALPIPPRPTPAPPPPTVRAAAPPLPAGFDAFRHYMEGQTTTLHAQIQALRDELARRPAAAAPAAAAPAAAAPAGAPVTRAASASGAAAATSGAGAASAAAGAARPLALGGAPLHLIPLLTGIGTTGSRDIRVRFSKATI